MAGANSVFSTEPRGFTGHEHLDDLGLIHMNGRIYDPQLGRFLSADFIIQFPKNMQSYNRYSYVLNNPLSYTDPSGHIIPGILAAIASFAGTVGMYVAEIAFALGVGGDIAMATYLVTTAVTYGAAMGMISGVASMALGGTFADGFRTGFQSGILTSAFSFIGGSSFGASGVTTGRVIAHGFVGGTVARVNGGQFISGFVSGAFTKSMSGFIQTATKSNFFYGAAVASVVGGTTSELTGGKFKNGAISAAFGYMFNHRKCPGSGQMCHGSVGPTKNEQRVIDAYNEVREEFPDLGIGGELSLNKTVSAYASLTGATAWAYRFSSTSIVYFGVDWDNLNGGSSKDLLKEIIFHELIHVDGAIARGISTSEYFDRLNSGLIQDDHIFITPLEIQYTGWQMLPNALKPDLNTLPWRQ